ncbi:MAG TPA: FAD-dependent oxidoreductase [Candidatus Elarobacter sp.]|jgi:sarcosine oxidase subunit beta|nr:FAD-dependent oxidoreductase [Candidatus Elarobacter sp.]
MDALLSRTCVRPGGARLLTAEAAGVRRKAAVAVVGGGVIGASVAFHLAARGARDVVVLDRAARPGEGSTGRATGGFRVQFASAVDVRLSLLAREKLRRFAEETGGDCGFVPAGYLWVARSDDELTALRRALAVQRANGVDDARELSAGEVAACSASLSADGIAGGAYCASDGFIRPLQILEGYRRAAERLGARFLWDEDVIGFRFARDGRITALRTARDEIAAECVVNAAGAWAGVVGRMAGADLPVTPLRRQVAVTVPTDLLPPAMPMTIFAGDGFHLRVRDGRVLLLLPSEGGPDPFHTRVEPAWIDRVSRVAHARVPCLANVEIDRAACWGGLYEMSPDGHAIVGVAPGVPNLVLANGASGHGVMHAPALGQLVAEIVLDGAAASLDVTALSPDRFARAGAHAKRELL